MSAGAVTPGSEQPIRRCPRCGEEYPLDYSVCPRDATPLVARSDDDPLIGDTLADTYEVTAPIAEGGMGRVYKAHHRRLGREFALKVMHAHLAKEPDAVARFRREATASLVIHSMHVAQVFDVDVTADGRPYLVCELLTGEELGEMLDREGALPIGHAAEIARQLCRAVGAAHAAGVVHRDLKPDNVMLETDIEGATVVKVVDFGIAKTLGTGPSLTRTGIVMGTPAYMAPEQAAGASDVDHRADIYAIGAILYHMLTGQKPFDADEVAATLAMVLRDEPERPRSVRPSIPEGLELIVQRAMGKQPRGRYQSTRELEVALAAYAEPLSGARPTAPFGSGNVDGTGKTVYAGTEAGVTAADARGVRPRLFALTAVLSLWMLVAVASLTGEAIRAVTSERLSLVESVLAGVLGIAIALPMLFAWVRHLAQGAWRNTVTCTLYAAALARILGISLGLFALTVGGARAAYLVVLGEPHVPDIYLAAGWAVAVASVAVPALVGALRRRRR